MKVLIVGCGGQGCLADAPGSGNEEKVISFAHAFKERGAELFFWDICNRKAYDAFKIWGGTAATIGYACDICGVDIVVVTSPDETHYEILEEITRRRHPKLVICEKPLCNTYKESKEIVEKYKSCGIFLLVNYTRRFIPKLRKLKEKYESGELGLIKYVNIAWNRGSMHTLSHAIDFVYWFFNDKNAFRINIADTSRLDYRVWQIQLFFEKFFFQEQRIFDMPVPSYFDLSTRYVVDNSYRFLEGKEALFCTGEDALESIAVIENTE